MTEENLEQFEIEDVKALLQEIHKLKEENAKLSTKLIETGKEKNDNHLMKISKEVVFNSDRPLQERYEGLMVLIDSANIRKNQIEHGVKRMQAYLNQLCEIALQEHKKKRIIQFTEKWAGKEVNEQMAIEMQQIEKPNHCYVFQGITVVEMECGMCKSRKCEKTEREYVANQFEELLDTKQESEVENGTNRE